jgi:hypothetical protein
MFKKSFCFETNLSIDNIVNKAERFGSQLASDIIIISVRISENNKLQNVDNVNVATSHKIFYAQSCFSGMHYHNNILFGHDYRPLTHGSFIIH